MKHAGSGEEEPIEQLRAGDRAAFEWLVRTHSGYVMAVAQRILRDPDESQDCLQEVMLSAYRAIDKFDGRSRLRTWLHRITVNAALMRLRSRRREERPIDDLLPQFDDRDCRIEAHRPSPPTPDELLATATMRATVREAILSLPEPHRSVLLLRDIEGLSTKEAADALDSSVVAVKTRLHRARSALKKLLEPVLYAEEES